jgi:hypothetical protein
MNHLDLLTFARGSALNWALVLFVAGVVLRLFEIFGLGRKADLASPRTNSPGSGWRTIVTRSFPSQDLLKRHAVTYFSGYVFHLGLLVTIFFFAPHIEFLHSMTGFGWPNLPTPLVDASAVSAIVALGVILVHRLNNPVLRMLSGVGGLSSPVCGIHPDVGAAPVLGRVVAGVAAVYQAVPQLFRVHLALV